MAVAGFEHPTPATGEQSVTVVHVNQSGTACNVSGVPEVELKDVKGHVMPFEYTPRAGMYVPHTAPARITLAPDARAYVKIGKYRCDLVGETPAVTAHLSAQGVDVDARRPEWGSLAHCGDDEPTGSVGVFALVDSFDAAGG